ncbi:hypothetical protein TanjilG_03522 [Lupinus angustifolius]|uniref:Uncharacterized protein n=1 Tax=Lupinus angustifolius TaxID=3871 RepID=A0A1J7FNZ6_LUPAN|nr:hypothetical protein TanjilG_03522 [Lupinus angustifolius]
MLCLLLLASNTVARKNVFVSNMFDGANEKNTSMEVDSHKCNLKSELSCSENNNTNSDDKRVVPTGPNPLHNR